MKKLFFVLFITANIANAQDLLCQVFVNTEISSEEKISIEDNEAKSFGKIPNYRFKISKNLNYQIEVYDESTPS